MLALIAQKISSFFGLVIKNIKNSFRNFRKIYLLLIVSQLISIISIFFIYGIYGSYSAKMQELDIDSYTIGTYFDECYIGGLKECLPGIMDQMGGKVEYVFIAGVSENRMISMYTEYHGGKYTLGKIVMENNLLKEGRELTYEDAINENQVIYSQFAEEHKPGNIINIEGEEFEIVGVDERDAKDLIIPYNSCPDKVELDMVYFNFHELPSQTEYRLIKDIFKNKFKEKFTIDEFEVRDEEEIISYRTMIIISIAIGLISALNTTLLYGYIIRQRRKQMVVYGIAGATKEMRFIINELEIMLTNFTVVIVGFLLFRFGMQKTITEIYENSVQLYSVNSYLIMILIYVFCIFVFTSVMLTIMNRETLIDMLRRTKND